MYLVNRGDDNDDTGRGRTVRSIVTSTVSTSFGITGLASICANPAGFYVNVHDATQPGGAARGQLSLVSQVVPTPTSGGATPELSSGELLLAGLLPVGAIVLYRRRAARRA